VALKCENPKAGDWDYDGVCRPTESDVQACYETFSLGVFQWIPKAGGKGVKRSAVVKRFRGSMTNPQDIQAVYRKADEFIEKMKNEAK
jgi:hypothetical protein